jgi:hypothetical protein
MALFKKGTEEKSVIKVSPESGVFLDKLFDQTNSFYSLLTTLRTRRVGMGYSIESGVPETFANAPERLLKQALGPLNHVSDKEPQGLSSFEEAVLCWAGAGLNGMVLGDIAVNGGLESILSLTGRTVPSSSNDLSVELVVVNDQGVFIYKPQPKDHSYISSKNKQDRKKIFTWYEEGMIQLSNSRPDILWPSAPEGTRNASALGAQQYNLNRPGSTWFLPIGDLGIEWFNQLLNAYELSGFYLQDPETMEPAGCKNWIKPGFLEVAFPIPIFDEQILMMHSNQVGAMIQNIRLACESLGLGAWVVGGYADDLVLGAYPDITNGLGFNYITRDPNKNPTLNPSYCTGLEGFKEATVVPSKKFPTPEQAIDFVIQKRIDEGLLKRELLNNPSLAPYKPDVLERIVNNENTYWADWTLEAAIATVEYIVDKYGCAPAFINPMRAKLSIQVHHLDIDFYTKYYTDEVVEQYIPAQFRNHFDNWH